MCAGVKAASDNFLEIRMRVEDRVQNNKPVDLFRGRILELFDIECALCHVTGVQFDKKMRHYESAIFDFI